MGIIVDPTITGTTEMRRGRIRTRTGRWMRSNMGSVGNKWANWGMSGLRKGAMEGWQRDLGFFQTAGGKHKFLGGKAGMRGLKALGVGAGVGAAVYGMTDSPLLGLGAGVGASMAAGGLKAAGKAGMNLLGPAFVGAGIVSGFQEGGVGGGLWGGAKAYGEMRIWGAGIKAVQVAFGGTKVAGAASGMMSIAKAVAFPLAVVAGIGYGAYKGAQYFSERGRAASRSEFAGDTAAFQTQAAYSMRQRAVQEISRSHTNSRTILGNEAQLMHLR